MTAGIFFLGELSGKDIVSKQSDVRALAAVIIRAQVRFGWSEARRSGRVKMHGSQRPGVAWAWLVVSRLGSPLGKCGVGAIS